MDTCFLPVIQSWIILLVDGKAYNILYVKEVSSEYVNLWQQPSKQSSLKQKVEDEQVEEEESEKEDDMCNHMEVSDDDKWQGSNEEQDNEYTNNLLVINTEGLEYGNNHNSLGNMESGRHDYWEINFEEIMMGVHRFVTVSLEDEKRTYDFLMNFKLGQVHVRPENNNEPREAVIAQVSDLSVCGT